MHDPVTVNKRMIEINAGLIKTNENILAAQAAMMASLQAARTAHDNMIAMLHEATEGVSKTNDAVTALFKSL